MDYLMIYCFALGFRLFLLFYGEWQDANMEVKFTDVDYFVFHDASEFVTMKDSPYLRATYRYSPILAWFLTPCVYLHKSWGKILFIFTDLVCAMCIRQILEMRQSNVKAIKAALMLWLFNPLTATVSCRGNAESILSFLVLAVLYALMKKRTVLAGFLYALAVHLKIYPAVYILCIILFLGSGYDKNQGKIVFSEITFMIKKRQLKNIMRKLMSYERSLFIGSSSFTFIVFTFGMYLLYGFDFFQHTYLYHITRRDVRHNFSVYFYMLYIDSSTWLSLFCFFNQIVVIFAISYAFYEDLPFCFFLLTAIFVTFNKICTSQYFLWYLCFVPLLFNGLMHIPVKQLFLPVAAWFFGQGFWLFFAGLLEFQGINTFLMLWISGIVFFVINILVLTWFIRNYRYTPIFDESGFLVSLFKNQNITKKQE